MTRHLDDRDDRVRARLAQEVDGVADVIGTPQGRRRLKQDDDVGRPSVARGLGERVLDDRHHRRVVGSQCRRPHERHLEAGAPARIGNLERVGAENHAIEHTRFACCARGVLEQRVTGERPHVLPGYAFRSAARRDKTENKHRLKP